jgi:hypothetical protein
MLIMTLAPFLCEDVSVEEVKTFGNLGDFGRTGREMGYRTGAPGKPGG